MLQLGGMYTYFVLRRFDRGTETRWTTLLAAKTEPLYNSKRIHSPKIPAFVNCSTGWRCVLFFPDDSVAQYFAEARFVYRDIAPPPQFYFLSTVGDQIFWWISARLYSKSVRWSALHSMDICGAWLFCYKEETESCTLIQTLSATDGQRYTHKMSTEEFYRPRIEFYNADSWHFKGTYNKTFTSRPCVRVWRHHKKIS